MQAKNYKMDIQLRNRLEISKNAKNKKKNIREKNHELPHQQKKEKESNEKDITKWTAHKAHFENPNCQLPYFEISGPNRNVSATLSPSGKLRLYMTDEILDQIAIEANRYYEQFHTKTIPNKFQVTAANLGYSCQNQRLFAH